MVNADPPEERGRQCGSGRNRQGTGPVHRGNGDGTSARGLGQRGRPGLDGGRVRKRQASWQPGRESERVIVPKKPGNAGGGNDPPFYSSSIAIPKVVFQDIGGFQEGEPLGADVDMWLRIGVHYPIVWNSEHLAEYNQAAVNREAGFKQWHREPPVSISARHALRPEGLLVLSTPNYLIPALRYPKKWGLLGGPLVHLNFFTPASLERVLQAAGFSSVKVVRQRLFRPSGGLRGVARSFRFLLGQDEPKTLPCHSPQDLICRLVCIILILIKSEEIT